MKNSKIKYIILTLALILACSLFLFSNPEPARTGYEHNVYQWLWSENIGWFSLNSINVSDPEEINYGLNIDYEAKTASGLTWSEHTGWICFGETCNSLGLDWWEKAFEDLGYDKNLAESWCWTPPGGQLKIQYAEKGETMREVEKGWGRIVNLAVYGEAVEGEDNWGWISLTWKNTNTPTHYWTHINLVNRTLGGWAWSGTVGDPNEGRGGYGWIAFKYKPQTVLKGTLRGTVTDAVTGDPIKGIKIMTDVYFHEGITDIDGKYELEPPGEIEHVTYTVTTFDPPDSPRTPKYNSDSKGATLDETHDPLTVNFALYKGIPEGCDKSISGFVYYDENENTIFDPEENPKDKKLGGAYVVIADANGYYFGPTSDNGEYKCTSACLGRDYEIFAYYLGKIEGEELSPQIISSGVVLEGGVTGANIPLPKRPSTPRITGPWIQTWWSDVHAENMIDVSATPAPHYANATYLVTAGGDIVQFTSFRKWRKPRYELGLPTDIQTLGDEIIDRLEGEAETVAPGTKSANDFVDLDPETPKVWKCDGDLKINGGKFGPGAKTIIVDGNLTFSGDVLYDTSQDYSSVELPSVGFIVKGDMEVEETVAHIVGNFYVINQISIVSTGDKTTEKQFVCEGLMIAHLFKFDRIIADAIPGTTNPWKPTLSDGTTRIHDYQVKEAPSEIIYYDSRVVVNTPKGFEDFSKALPVWEER